jgi:hypothetical protein
MKIRESKRGSEEREVLIGMIVDRDVLGMVSSRYTPGMFGSRWANVIGKWCVDYFKKYHKAPYKQIASIFQTWSEEKERDKETVDLIEKFLNALSDQYRTYRSEINPQYVIDKAAKYFQRVQLEKLKEDLEEELNAGNIEDARNLVNKYRPVEVGAGVVSKMVVDEESIKLSFANKRETQVIIKYPGALGEFFGDTFERDSFVSFEGMEKKGKSFWLMDVVWRTMLERRKVAFFSVGDMSKNQVIRRFAARATFRPVKPSTIKIPKYINRKPADIYPTVKHKEKTFDKSMKWQEAWKAFQEWGKALRGTDYIRLSVHPNSTISAEGIHETINLWQNEGWVPDVIVIDYADILAPINSKEAKIEQIDETWRYLRRMSQELHCCVVTATQTNRESYKAKTIQMHHAANDKRKRAHVTASIGINQDNDEKALGVFRLNYVVRREDDYSSDRVVYTASCLGIGNPAVLSCK